MLNKIGLITPPTKSHRTAEETIALGYLSSLLREAGYEVSVVDGWLERLSPEEMAAKLSVGRLPSLIGMSCYRSNIEQAMEVLKVVREKFGHISAICGGYGPTFHDEIFLGSGFTVVVRGEAEHIIVPLVNALIEKKDLRTIPGISFNQDGKVVRTQQTKPIIDLDEIPFPERDTVESTIEQKNFVHLCTSRGCEAHCSFCSIFSFALTGSREKRWRQRSISNIVKEVKYLYERYGVRHFKFVDDSFLEPPREESWVGHFRDEVLRYQLPIRFRTQVRSDRLTPTIVRDLKEAGWLSTSLGVENASATALKRMAKSASQTENAAAIEMLTENKIYVQMGMILFDPDTTMVELQENLQFLKRYAWPITKGIFTEMYAAEGTPFTQKLKQRGLLRVDALNQNHEYPIVDSNVRRVYAMLKAWHRSHSSVYDWVIDSLTAPKVLPDSIYGDVHGLYQELRELDLSFFDTVLSHAEETSNEKSDEDLTAEAIMEQRKNYSGIKLKISEIYAKHGLCYEAVPNPFLGSV